MKIFKKTLAMLLCLLMLTAAVPFTVFADSKAVSTRYVSSWFELKNMLEYSADINIVIKEDIIEEYPAGSNGLTEPIEVVANKTLDLNGKKVQVKDYSNVNSSKDQTEPSGSSLFDIKGNLTINDSVGGGKITNEGYFLAPSVWLFDETDYRSWSKRDIFYVFPEARLTINDGTFVAGGNKEQYLSDEAEYAQFIIPGTVITFDGSNNSTKYAKVTINGGTFIGNGITVPAFSHLGSVIENRGITEIYDGTFLLNGEGLLLWNRTNDAIINIYNGLFVSNSFDRIRIFPESNAQGDNSYKEGTKVDYNISDQMWKNNSTQAYVNGVKLDKSEVEYFEDYKDGGIVEFKSETITGSVIFTSSAVLGKKTTCYLSGKLGEIYNSNPSSVHFQWQIKHPKIYEWENIPSANGKDYTPTPDVYKSAKGEKSIRVMVTVDGYANNFISPILILGKQQRYDAPVRPTATADYANKTISIHAYNTFTDQEFVISTSATPDWENDKKPDANGVFTNLTQDTKYYIHTRFKETDYCNAGEYAVYTQVTLAQTVYLTDIEIVTEKVTAKAGDYVKISVNPIPANATNFNGISNWYLNSGLGSDAILYDNVRGSKIKSGTSYKTVYLMGVVAETVKVTGEYTFGYNDIRIRNVTVDISDTSGKFAFGNNEISYSPDYNLTVERGSVQRISLYSNQNLSKTISTASFAYSSGVNHGGIQFNKIAGSNDIEIIVPETAKLGTGYYTATVNGTKQINQVIINVTEKDIPVEKVTLDKSGLTLGVGKTHNLTAAVYPSNATNSAITWKSSNAAVATVSSAGKVTAIKAGTATITATAGGVSVSCNVTVSEDAEKFTVDITHGTASSYSAAAGTKITITADAATSGVVFDKWMANGVALDNVNSATTTFTMPSKNVSVTATYKVVTPPVATKYTITVTNGTASKVEAEAGETVTLTANAAPEGKEFDKWVVTGATVADESKATTTFKMSAANVTAKATYKDMTVTPPVVTEYTITVTSGTASKAKAKAGETITLTANAAPEGKVFDKWVVTGATVADATKATTTFKMPSANITAKATYKNKAVTPPTEPVTYAVTVTNGVASAETATAGTTVTLDAKQIDGKVFSHWVVEGATVEDEKAAETTFVMGNIAVNAEAVYTDCECNCHKGGIIGFFYKIILFFQKLFGKNLVCEACGAKH